MYGNHAIVPLKGFIQKYAWGKQGKESKVAQLVVPEADINENETFAELWMGTHPRGPSVLLNKDGTPSTLKLVDFIREHGEDKVLGTDITKTFGENFGKLPYMLKVLSVGKSLSVQIHPDLQQARELHQSKPDLYPDPNHKPEMAIAISQFEVLTGFRPMAEIQRFILNLEPLQRIVGPEIVAKFRSYHTLELDTTTGYTTERTKLSPFNQELLKSTFKTLMECDKEVIKMEVDNLRKIFKKLEDLPNVAENDFLMVSLFTQLSNQYPGDVGCFCIYFLNDIILKPGEAVYLGPNTPHAYLYGDCVECMACSDNVIRAGLTPKYIDVDTLISLVDYNSHPISEVIFHPIPLDKYTLLYEPPINDFGVSRTTLPHDNSAGRYQLKKRSSCSILLVISGKAVSHSIPNTTKSESSEEFHLKPGSILFIAADAILSIDEVMSSVNHEDLVIFRAYSHL